MRDNERSTLRTSLILTEVEEISIMKATFNDKPFDTTKQPWLKEDGVEKHYNKDGSLTYKAPFVNGQRHGVMKHYYDNDSLNWETPYVNGQIHGVVKNYSQDGSLKWETLWVNGQVHGVEKRYREDGSLAYETPWVNGQRRLDLLRPENRLSRLVLLGK